MIELPEDFRDLLIDIVNHADGIHFDDAIEGGDGFELEGRRIPVIGLQALLRNKRAAGREQDLADVKALEVAAERFGASG